MNSRAFLHEELSLSSSPLVPDSREGEELLNKAPYAPPLRKDQTGTAQSGTTVTCLGTLQTAWQEAEQQTRQKGLLDFTPTLPQASAHI